MAAPPSLPDLLEELEMESDLVAALGGLDAEEMLLAEDPSLASVAMEIYEGLELRSMAEEDSWRFEELPVDCQDQQQQSVLPPAECPSSSCQQEESSELPPSPQWNSSASSVSSSPAHSSASDASSDSGVNLKMTSSDDHKINSSGSSTNNCRSSNSKRAQKSKLEVATFSATICVACGRPARGYKYFGAIVCNSCRAFFSRSIKGSVHRDFICQMKNGRKDGCILDSKSWASCQKCRFARCLDVGMCIPGETAAVASSSSDSSSSGNNNNSVSLPSNSAYKKAQLDYIELVIGSTRKLLRPACSLTSEEKEGVELVVDRQFKMGMVNMSKLIRSNIDIFRSTLEFFFRGRAFPLKIQKQVEDYMIYATNHAYSSADVPLDWLSLKARDRHKLMAANFPLVRISCSLPHIEDIFFCYQISEFTAGFNMNPKKSKMMKDHLDGYIKSVSEDEENDEDFVRATDNMYKEVCVAL